MATDWQDIEARYYMQTVRRQPVVIVRGVGTRVWDVSGKEYLDFTAGWAVNNVGHSNSIVAEAISLQANTLLHTSNQFFTVPQLELAQVLVDNCSLDRVFFCNSGAEANEGAVKLARKYGKLNRDGAYEIIVADGSFHGRTIAMMDATGHPPSTKENFQPLPGGFVHVPYDDVTAIKDVTCGKTAAVMLEPVQGEGGVNVPKADYLSQVRRWCDDNGLLFILDEVQTGLGRLGTLFGYQSFGVDPDVMTLAKGLGGGVPIGAFLAKNEFCVLEPGDHGSTFGGNALTCAAATASTRYIVENDIPAKVLEKGGYLRRGLNRISSEMDCIDDVRGMGLLFAVQFTSEISSLVVSNCNEAGILLNMVKPNTVRLMPPLTVTEDEIDEALARFRKGLESVLEESST